MDVERQRSLNGFHNLGDRLASPAQLRCERFADSVPIRLDALVEVVQRTGQDVSPQVQRIVKVLEHLAFHADSMTRRAVLFNNDPDLT